MSFVSSFMEVWNAGYLAGAMPACADACTPLYKALNNDVRQSACNPFLNITADEGTYSLSTAAWPVITWESGAKYSPGQTLVITTLSSVPGTSTNILCYMTVGFGIGNTDDKAFNLTDDCGNRKLIRVHLRKFTTSPVSFKLYHRVFADPYFLTIYSPPSTPIGYTVVGSHWIMNSGSYRSEVIVCLPGKQLLKIVHKLLHPAQASADFELGTLTFTLTSGTWVPTFTPVSGHLWSYTLT